MDTNTKKDELKILLRELVVALEKVAGGNDLLLIELAEMIPDISREYVRLKEESNSSLRKE
jgi:hypothetical protein